MSDDVISIFLYGPFNAEGSSPIGTELENAIDNRVEDNLPCGRGLYWWEPSFVFPDEIEKNVEESIRYARMNTRAGRARQWNVT